MYESNAISNPFVKGDTVIIPKGTVVHSTNPSKSEYVTKRNQKVNVFMAGNGWVETDRYYGDVGMVKLPRVSWAGTGGYWCDVQVTPEFLAANGHEPAQLPGQDGKINHTTLDVIPSYDDGYTDKWAA